MPIHIQRNTQSAHQPALVREMEDIANTFRALPNQLFVQAYLTMELVMKACEIGSLYFVQRTPKERANFTWFIDRKDKTLTEMEELWSTFILPAQKHSL